MKTIKINNDICCAKQKDPDADTPVCMHTRTGRSALERKIDQMVCKPHNLTPEEITIVEGKR